MFKQESRLRSSAIAAAVAAAALAAAPAAHAVPVAWTNWTALNLGAGTAAGVITPSSGPAINVSLTGPNAGGSISESFVLGLRRRTSAASFPTRRAPARRRAAAT